MLLTVYAQRKMMMGMGLFKGMLLFVKIIWFIVSHWIRVSQTKYELSVRLIIESERHMGHIWFSFVRSKTITNEIQVITWFYSLVHSSLFRVIFKGAAPNLTAYINVWEYSIIEFNEINKDSINSELIVGRGLLVIRFIEWLYILYIS